MIFILFRTYKTTMGDMLCQYGDVCEDYVAPQQITQLVHI